MSLLTKEEIDKLKANPETAALGEKLEKTTFIPKERFDEVNEAQKKQAEELKKFQEAEEARKAEIQKAADEKRIAEGKTKEILSEREKELTEQKRRADEAEAKAKKLEDEKLATEKAKAEQEKADRTKALERIADAEAKKIAGLLPTAADINAFVELQATKTGPDGKPRVLDGKGGTKPQFKNRQEAEEYWKSKGKQFQ